jgi:hypothetical protein
VSLGIAHRSYSLVLLKGNRDLFAAKYLNRPEINQRTLMRAGCEPSGYIIPVHGLDSTCVSIKY